MRRLLAVLAAPVVVVVLCAASWPVDHGDRRRTGYLPSQTAFSHLSTAFTKALDGKVYGSPILAGSSVVVATENNTVYSFDANTGALHWKKHLRTPVTSGLPCGNINPLGITSTPVYDPDTNRIFVLTESPDSTTVARHDIYSLGPALGTIAWTRRVDVTGPDPKAMQQRGALALDGRGHLFIPFGGLAGDCGDYKGTVVEIKTSGVLGGHAYIVPTTREAGIWAAGGPAITAGGSVYVAVGNGESTTTFDFSDSVTRLSWDMKRVDYFAPTTWASDNASDLDLGSMTPAITADGHVLQAGKSGKGYVLDYANLGHIGGELYQASLCSAFGVSAIVGNSVYVPCTNGVTRVDVTSNGHFSTVWTQASAPGSPVVGNGAVYTLGGTNHATLYALSTHSGAVLGSVGVGTTTRFATPALGASKIYVGTEAGLVAINVA